MKPVAYIAAVVIWLMTLFTAAWRVALGASAYRRARRSLPEADARVADARAAYERLRR